MTELCIHFTQFLRPNGRPQQVWIEQLWKEEVADAVHYLQSVGCEFTTEVLQTNEVVFYISWPPDIEAEGDGAVEICNNGPEVLGVLDKLFVEFAQLVKETLA